MKYIKYIKSMIHYIRYFKLKLSVKDTIKYIYLGLRYDSLYINKLGLFLSEQIDTLLGNFEENFMILHIINYISVFNSYKRVIPKYLYKDHFLNCQCKKFINNNLNNLLNKGVNLP